MKKNTEVYFRDLVMSPTQIFKGVTLTETLYDKLNGELVDYILVKINIEPSDYLGVKVYMSELLDKEFSLAEYEKQTLIKQLEEQILACKKQLMDLK